MTRQFADVESLVDEILARTEGQVVLALPLGLGKANHIANELYLRVEKDQSLSLKIITALTLEAPRGSTELEKRFLKPLHERFWKGYPPLSYALARQRGALPDNIQVEEFFFQAGSLKGNASAQQHHICANYTHALQYVMQRGINVLAQSLSSSGETSDESPLSSSCNPDFTGDLLRARRDGDAQFIFCAQVNNQLPYFLGDAAVPRREVDLLLEDQEYDFPLFCVPKTPLTNADHAAGLHVASLIRDGGTLQIGIGSLGDAVAQGLMLRHCHNRTFKHLMKGLSVAPPLSGLDLQQEPFSQGLHGVSEMLVDVFLDLMDAGILTREVDGKVLHGAFFVGDERFYRRLRELPQVSRDRINLCSVLFANELYGDESFKRRQRQHARFINKAMMVTAMGEVVSDGLEDGVVIGGVGGQYNFVAQAFALRDARSIIVVPATRQSNGKVRSNIVWKYANTTIPRHLRDIVVTEYGIADLRGKNDADVIVAMLAITDSRFQEELLADAVRAGKVPPGYRIPERLRHNLPETLEGHLDDFQDRLSPFPFGSDFTTADLRVLPVLSLLKDHTHSRMALLGLLLSGMVASGTDGRDVLQRLDLTVATSWRERMMRWLVLGALKRVNPEH